MTKDNRGTLNGSKWIRSAKRLRIYARDGFVCALCGEGVALAGQWGRTLDHLKPRSAGGSNHERNLVTCCGSCNSSRQERTVAEVADAEALARIRRFRRRTLPDLEKALAIYEAAKEQEAHERFAEDSLEETLVEVVA